MKVKKFLTLAILLQLCTLFTSDLYSHKKRKKPIDKDQEEVQLLSSITRFISRNIKNGQEFKDFPEHFSKKVKTTLQEAFPIEVQNGDRSIFIPLRLVQASETLKKLSSFPKKDNQANSEFNQIRLENLPIDAQTISILEELIDGKTVSFSPLNNLQNVKKLIDLLRVLEILNISETNPVEHIRKLSDSDVTSLAKHFKNNFYKEEDKKLVIDLLNKNGNNLELFLKSVEVADVESFTSSSTHEKSIHPNSLKDLLTNQEGRIEQSFFTPDDDISQLLIKMIKEERKSIKLAMFFLTNLEVIEELTKVDKAISIEVILDKSGITNHNKEALTKLSKRPNTKLHIYTKSGRNSLMHNKYFIFEKNLDDKKILTTGSFNCTYQAQRSNKENLIVTESYHLINEYEKNFENLKKENIQDFTEKTNYNNNEKNFKC